MKGREKKSSKRSRDIKTKNEGKEGTNGKRGTVE
jgi:hypothetical protein